jgi:hypothetical protein
MLKEAHISFRVAEQYAIRPEHTEKTGLILCADPEPTDPLMDVLEEAAAKKIPLFWTGTAWRNNLSPRFMKLFSVQEAGTSGEGRCAYLSNGPKDLFTSLRETDWTLFDGPEVPVKGVEGCDYALEKISPGFFGPPEMCGGNKPTGEHALLISEPNRTMVFPFQPGYLYMRYGYDEYRHMIIDCLRNKGWLRSSLSVDAHPMVEVFLNRYRQDKAPALYNIQLINLSGYNGVSFHKPVPVKDIPVTMNLIGEEVPHELFSLTSGQKLPFEVKKRKLSFSVPLLDAYEMLIIK